MAAELPALWPNLIDILHLEKTNFLPDDVVAIILKLIWIRRSTFLTAAVRAPDDYVEWENKDEEHSTMFYPNWPIWRYPKKYEVRNVTDCDFCEKGYINMHELKGVVFDFACGLDQYILNREPREFEHLSLLL